MTGATTTRSVEHATFVLDRFYPVPRERVYAAMANQELKAKWFGSEDGHVSWSYNRYVDDVKLSSSLTVVELTTVPEGTKLTFTETGAYFDGYEKPAMREEGSGWILDALGATLVPVVE